MGGRDLMVKSEQVEGITIISIHSPRISAELADSFEAQVVHAVDCHASSKVLIDFTGVSFISSAVLGKLIKLNGRVVTDRHGQFKLSSLAERISEVFRITGLEKLFSIHETREEALGAFER